jgi:hypothetical protein
MATKKKRSARVSRVGTKEVSLKIEPFGPKPAEMEVLAQRIIEHKAVQTMLSKTHHRLLYIDLLDSEDGAKLDRPKPSERFLATFYDYTNNRTVLATGHPPAELAGAERIRTTPGRARGDAVQTLREDPRSDRRCAGRLIPYQPPPLVGRELPDE